MFRLSIPNLRDFCTSSLLVLVAICNCQLVLGDELRKPAWFFVQTSSTASLEDRKLVMPVERKVFAFTSYLYHRSYSYMDALEFTSLWDQRANDLYSFNGKPPWAVLSWVIGEDVHSFEFKINKASFDLKEGHIFYSIEFLGSVPFLPKRNAYSLFIEAECEPAGLSRFFMKPDCDCTVNCDNVCRTMCWR